MNRGVKINRGAGNKIMRGAGATMYITDHNNYKDNQRETVVGLLHGGMSSRRGIGSRIWCEGRPPVGRPVFDHTFYDLWF